MHDPSVVAFEIRRPWPQLSRIGNPRPGGPRWEFRYPHASRWRVWQDWMAFWTVAGRRLYWPALVTVWHVEPDGHDALTVCGRDKDGKRSHGRDEPAAKWWRVQRRAYHHECSSLVHTRRMVVECGRRYPYGRTARRPPHRQEHDVIHAGTAAEAAAIWWAQQVGAPVYRMVDDQSPAEDHQAAGMASAMAHMLADRHPVSTERGELFVKALTKTLTKWLKRSDWCSLAVDYGPDYELAKAAEAAGIHPSRFPWKTHMSIRPDHVVASLGYRAPDTLVWHAPDWQRPVCGTQRYEEGPGGHYESRDETCGLLRYHPEDHGDYQPDHRTCSGCGLTYSGHYATERGSYTHSWEPTTEEAHQ